MSRPRTPEHFPRMKVRGGRRRARARATQRRTDLRRVVSVVSRVDWAAVRSAAADALTRAVDSAGRALVDMGRVLFTPPRPMRVPHVDEDIQDFVEALRPGTLGQRLAIERTLQNRRDAGLVVLGVTPTEQETP